MTDHFEQSASGMMILLVNLQMLVELVNTEGENRDLNLGRTGVAGMGCVLLNDSSLFFFAHHSVFPPFKSHFPLSKSWVWQNRLCKNRAVSRN